MRFIASLKYVMTVVIVSLMLYNGVQEMIYFEADSQTHLHNTSPE
jgi:hypothetical protein